MSYILNGDGTLRIDYYDAPVLNDLTLAAGGSLSPNTTYYYRIMPLNVNSPALATIHGKWSNIKSITTTTNNKTINLSWSNVGASYYFLCRSLTGNFNDAENFLISNSSSANILTNITGTSAIDNGTNYPYSFRTIYRPNGIPKLTISGNKTLKDIYDFIISLPAPLNAMIKLFWPIESNETSVAPFTGTYQPLIWQLDLHILLQTNGILIIKNTIVIVRGTFITVENSTFTMGEKAASGMTSKGAILFQIHTGYSPYSIPYFVGASNIYNSKIICLAQWCAPVPAGAGNYQKYMVGSSNNIFANRDPSEFLDSEVMSSQRLYATVNATYGGSLLIKNSKIEDGEWEQYYQAVTINNFVVEGKGYGVWIYYDQVKIYNINIYDASYDLGIHMGSVSGNQNYIELVNPILKARNQAVNLNPYIYLATAALNKWMRIYFELKIKIINADGIPIENVLVQIITADNMEYSDLTDSNGETILFEVREGKYTFNPGGITREGYLSNLIAQGYIIKSAGNPITITVSKANYKTQVKITEILEKSSWVFGMEPITPGITESFNADLSEDSISCSIIEDEISVNISD